MKFLKSASSLLFIFAIAVLFSTAFGWNLYAVGGALLAASFIPMPSGILAINLATINTLASQAGMSRYEGDANQYTGKYDPFLDFGGDHVDFATEMGSAKPYAITITNTGSGAVAQKILLTPSYVPSSVDRVIRDGAIPVGASNTVSSSGSPTPIANWLKFIEINPSRVLGFQVVSDISAQLSQIVSITQKSPYSTLEDDSINLASFRTEFANNDKMVTIRRQFQVDSQTEVAVTVPAGATTTFTFYMGANINVAQALAVKSAVAGASPAVQNARQLSAAQ